MKKWIAALIVLFALYGGLWFYGSQQAKKYTDEKWNELAEKAEERGYELRKKDSSITGFPLGYTLTINSPSLRSKTSENFETNLDGTVTIHSNLFGNRYTVSKTGTQHIFIAQGNEPKKHYILSGDLSLAFDMPNKSFLEGVAKPYEALMDEDERVEADKLKHNNSVLKIDHLKLVNADIPTLNILEIDKGFLASTYADRGEEQKISLEGDFKGFDMLFGGAESYTPSEKRSLQEIAVMLSVPKAGKNDISFGLDFVGPIDALSEVSSETLLKDGIPPFTLTLNNLKASNDFVNSYAEGKIFAKEKDEEGQKFHVNFKSTADVSEKQEARFREQWENFLSNLPVCDGKFEPDVCVSAKNIVPSWNKQGKIVTHLDFDYDLINPDQPLAGSALVVKNMDLYSDLYGIKSHGDLILKDPLSPKATYLIELPNFAVFLKDIFNYLNGIRGLLPALAPELRNTPPLSDEHLETTVQFLRSISDHPDQNSRDLSITFHVNGWTSISIGKLTAEEFVARLNQFIQQFQTEKNSTIKTETNP